MGRKTRLIITLTLPIIISIFWSFFTVAVLTEDGPGVDILSEDDLSFFATTAVLTTVTALTIYAYVTYRWIDKLEDKRILAVTIPMTIINIAYIIFRFVAITSTIIVAD